MKRYTYRKPPIVKTFTDRYNSCLWGALSWFLNFRKSWKVGLKHWILVYFGTKPNIIPASRLVSLGQDFLVRSHRNFAKTNTQKEQAKVLSISSERMVATVLWGNYGQIYMPNGWEEMARAVVERTTQVTSWKLCGPLSWRARKINMCSFSALLDSLQSMQRLTIGSWLDLFIIICDFNRGIWNCFIQSI